MKNFKLIILLLGLTLGGSVYSMDAGLADGGFDLHKNGPAEVDLTDGDDGEGPDGDDEQDQSLYGKGGQDSGRPSSGSSDGGFFSGSETGGSRPLTPTDNFSSRGVSSIGADAADGLGDASVAQSSTAEDDMRGNVITRHAVKNAIKKGIDAFTVNSDDDINRHAHTYLTEADESELQQYLTDRHGPESQDDQIARLKAQQEQLRIDSMGQYLTHQITENGITGDDGKLLLEQAATTSGLDPELVLDAARENLKTAIWDHHTDHLGGLIDNGRIKTPEDVDGYINSLTALDGDDQESLRQGGKALLTKQSEEVQQVSSDLEKLIREKYLAAKKDDKSPDDFLQKVAAEFDTKTEDLSEYQKEQVTDHIDRVLESLNIDGDDDDEDNDDDEVNWDNANTNTYPRDQDGKLISRRDSRRNGTGLFGPAEGGYQAVSPAEGGQGGSGYMDITGDGGRPEGGAVRNDSYVPIEPDRDGNLSPAEQAAQKAVGYNIEGNPNAYMDIAPDGEDGSNDEWHPRNATPADTSGRLRFATKNEQTVSSSMFRGANTKPDYGDGPDVDTLGEEDDGDDQGGEAPSGMTDTDFQNKLDNIIRSGVAKDQFEGKYAIEHIEDLLNGDSLSPEQRRRVVNLLDDYQDHLTRRDRALFGRSARVEGNAFDDYRASNPKIKSERTSAKIKNAEARRRAINVGQSLTVQDHINLSRDAGLSNFTRGMQELNQAQSKVDTPEKQAAVAQAKRSYYQYAQDMAGRDGVNNQAFTTDDVLNAKNPNPYHLSAMGKSGFDTKGVSGADNPDAVNANSPYGEQARAGDVQFERATAKYGHGRHTPSDAVNGMGEYWEMSNPDDAEDAFGKYRDALTSFDPSQYESSVNAQMALNKLGEPTVQSSKV